MISSNSSVERSVRRSSSNPNQRIRSFDTPSFTKWLMAISIIVDFPHLLTPGMVMIFFRLMGNSKSRSITSKGISLCLSAISDLNSSFFMTFLYFVTNIAKVSQIKGKICGKFPFFKERFSKCDIRGGKKESCPWGGAAFGGYIC